MSTEEDLENVEDEIRTPQEIAKRAIVVANLISIVYGRDINVVTAWLKQESLWNELTPEELSFLGNHNDEKKRIKISWRVEALVVLLWSIRKLDKMPSLKEECDPSLLKKVLVYPPQSAKNFIDSAKLRDDEEIHDEYEIVYDAHWSVRDAQINRRPIPNNYSSGVVYERHFGFNFVTGYCGLPWDEITTDT